MSISARQVRVHVHMQEKETQGFGDLIWLAGESQPRRKPWMVPTRQNKGGGLGVSVVLYDFVNSKWDRRNHENKDEQALEGNSISQIPTLNMESGKVGGEMESEPPRCVWFRCPAFREVSCAPRGRRPGSPFPRQNDLGSLSSAPLRCRILGNSARKHRLPKSNLLLCCCSSPSKKRQLLSWV